MGIPLPPLKNIMVSGYKMKFSSRRDLVVCMAIYGAIAVMLAPLYPLVKNETGPGTIGIIIFCLAISGLLLWILFGTRYEIDNTHILYRSGPIKGRIEIEKIHTVIDGKNLYVGFRPATALKGIIIKYGKYDEIYFSPETNEAFIKELLKIKPEIQIEKYKRA